MIKIENVEVVGWEQAIRGMRNPMNSWDRSDSSVYCSDLKCTECYYGDADKHCNIPASVSYLIGPNDLDLMKRLVAGGPVHAKFRRMITVYMDITAPLYWWKEFDTYKVGTVANSCSTMHKIHAKEFTLDDFSHEHLFGLISEPESEVDHDCWIDIYDGEHYHSYESITLLNDMIVMLNKARNLFLEYQEKAKSGNEFAKAHAKDYWWQMIQLLPSSYNQRRTVMLNYEVLANIYQMRKEHKLDEWKEFCKMIESLPYSEIIT